MPLNNTSKNLMLTQLAGVVAYVSAHTGDPGTTGANEVSGGSYARKAIAWGAASAGQINATGTVDISIPGSTTVSYVGLWSAVTGGTFYGSDDIAAETFAAAGTLRINSAEIDLNA